MYYIDKSDKAIFSVRHDESVIKNTDSDFEIVINDKYNDILLQELNSLDQERLNK